MTTQSKPLPNDIELLKGAHIHDLAAIASKASREDIITALRYHDSAEGIARHGLRNRNARRPILSLALQATEKKGAPRS